MSKTLSIAVPCYNSQDYMRKCIDSLLVGGEKVEIIIVDDGSTDQTPAIADQYVAEYPDICKVIHKENGGHGDAINVGLKLATGYFFKVVDSDDYVDDKAYAELLEIMEKMIFENIELDILISNYTYDKQGTARKKIMEYTGIFPTNKLFSWENVGHFKKTKYLLMHSVIYRTQLLRDCGIDLPKHTFYEDNIFVFEPLPYVKKMYYADVNFYRYFIGREDQSVNENVMIERIDQQYRVNRLLIDYFDYDAVKNKKCRKYMTSYLAIITAISSIIAILSNSPDDLEKRKKLWMYLKESDIRIYKKIRWNILGICANFPGKIGRKTSVACYRMTQRIFKFN